MPSGIHTEPCSTWNPLPSLMFSCESNSQPSALLSSLPDIHKGQPRVKEAAPTSPKPFKMQFFWSALCKVNYKCIAHHLLMSILEYTQLPILVYFISLQMRKTWIWPYQINLQSKTPHNFVNVCQSSGFSRYLLVHDTDLSLDLSVGTLPKSSWPNCPSHKRAKPLLN